MNRLGRSVLVAIGIAGLIVTSACSSSGSDSGSGSQGSTRASTSTTTSSPGATSSTAAPFERPKGPAADLSEKLKGGGGPFLADVASGIELPKGWTEDERVASGTAHAYVAEGDQPADGAWNLKEDDATKAKYRTRVFVRRPPAADFNGTVVVEWLNVSGGLDANPDYVLTHEELTRDGYAWVGVSAQKIGVEGGPVAVGVDIAQADGIAGKGLKGIDPARYGSLDHPGDAFSYDMYTEVARGLRAGGTDGPLGGLKAERILADGESQSAFALTTYADGVQPLTKAFDGFLIHSRGGAPLGLGKPGGSIDIAGAIGGQATRIRTDLDVPVLILETETDLFSVIGYLPARQPDTDKIRLWEMAGTAHADKHLLGSIASEVDCGVPINDGPQHFIAKAAIRSLDTWMRTGKAPPKAPRLDTKKGPADALVAARDSDGIIEGGIRTPVVDVPADVLSGEPGPDPSVVCLLLGSTKPLPPARLAQLYTSRADYLAKYEKSTDATLKAGFVLAADRKALLGAAQPDRIAER